MPDWISFWNSPNRIYVNARHRDVHYRDVALAIRSFVTSGATRVLDYGCGEATRADLVAADVDTLILSDGAPAVREKLAHRFRGQAKITVLAPDEVAALPASSIDLIVLNSVAQYLKPEELAALLAMFRRLLAAESRLVVGDVLPPHSTALREIAALLTLAWNNGFVLAALGGLVRTLFSNYRALRAELGLTHYSEAAMLDLLRSTGFTAQRHYPNIEHNQARMTFLAIRRRDGESPATAR